MITIDLDTPVKDGEVLVKQIVIETPILAVHLLKAMRVTKDPALQQELFLESACGVSRGFLEKLSLEDFAKLQAAIGPLLAPFSRFSGGAA